VQGANEEFAGANDDMSNAAIGKMGPSVRSFFLLAGLPLLLAMLCACACSAPAQIRDLREAEAHERGGRNEAALQSYESAMHTCNKAESARRRRDSCAAAHLQHAELLVSMERYPEAISAYHEAERVLAKTAAAAAQACYDAALVYLKMEDLEGAYTYLWRTITNYPDEAFAADALKRILRDGRVRAPSAIHKELIRLNRDLAETKIADNLLYALAQLEEVDLGDANAALGRYDALVKHYPKSGLYDDSLWHGARLSRQLGDAKGAVQHLRKLVATREVAFGAGSYFSVWLDNAQLELGIILRDDLQDYPAAIKAFTRLASDYPASILRDDALFERAVAKERAGQAEAACKDLAKLLKKYPDSKYTLSAVPKLRSALSCNL
jgi:TolA-binding protein